jgi:hypothetical protein
MRNFWMKNPFDVMLSKARKEDGNLGR